MTIPERLALLRSKMADHKLDAYYIPTADPHQCEYLAEHDKTRAFISGFTGSAGTVLVTKTEALLWTDGRYFLQAEKELNGSGITLQKSGEPAVPTLFEYLASSLSAGSRLGMDGKVVSVEMYTSLCQQAPNAVLVTDVDLVGEIWKDRPEPVLSKAFVHDIQYTGASAKEKIQKVRLALREKGAEATVIGALEDVCYVYNIRGYDIEATPVVTAYAIIDEQRACLYIDERQITEPVKKYLDQQGITLAPYEAVFADAARLSGTVYIDPKRINVLLRNALKTAVIEGLNITSSMKAVKNEVEIKNCRNAFVKDGVAMVKMLKWLEDHADAGCSEWDVSERLLAFRAEQKDFLEVSFTTIAGYGANAAVIHYAPKPETAAVLKPRGFLLLDSGGQYLDGTTDITRTIPLGPLTESEREDYTMVLKAHIQLALAVFPENTLGYKLDMLSRAPLWREGKDYKHGTGHGVGYVLSVHEGPQSIASRYSEHPMQEGMITSNEPGMYCAGSHGIRIESLTLTQKWKTTEYGTFLRFETLTLCPIDTRPVIKEALLDEERAWLNAYHQQVYAALAPYLDEVHRQFLQEKTQAL
ncbi:MAG: aminopeptidase P family protein [Treponema sp.]